jgi:hypothetical protein
MVGPFQYTYIFDMPGHGFTETHWREGPGSETLLQAFEVAQELGRRRQVMSGAQTILQGVRISNAELAGRKGTTQQEAILGNSAHGSTASNVALNVAIATANNEESKTTQMRGFWDDEEITGGALLKSSAFRTAFNSWAQYYTSKNFGWYGQNATTAEFPIIGYSVTAQGVVTLQVQGDLTGKLAINKARQVRITGLNGGSSQLNGEQVVIFTSYTAPISTVLVKFPIALTAFSQIGFLVVHNYTFRPGVNLSMQRVGTRQAGAPLLRSRGRSAKRKRV